MPYLLTNITWKKKVLKILDLAIYKWVTLIRHQKIPLSRQKYIQNIRIFTNHHRQWHYQSKNHQQRRSLKMGENNNKEGFGQTLLKYLLFTFVWHSISTTLFLFWHTQALYQDYEDCMSTPLQYKHSTETLTKNAELQWGRPQKHKWVKN